MEGLLQDDHYEIFARVVLFEVETFEVAVAPFEIVADCLGAFLQEPEIMLGAE